jgi:hypothetical protein
MLDQRHPALTVSSGGEGKALEVEPLRCDWVTLNKKQNKTKPTINKSPEVV